MGRHIMLFYEFPLGSVKIIKYERASQVKGSIWKYMKITKVNNSQTDSVS